MKEYEEEQRQMQQLNEYFKSRSKNSNNQVVEAEFTLFEQRLQQKKSNQAEMSKCMKKFKETTHTPKDLSVYSEFVSNLTKK